MAVDLPLTFLLAAGALVLAPGPDTFYVLDRGLRGGGRGVGLAAAAGIATGILVHTAGVTLGLSALLRTSPSAYSVLRYAGAAYLLLLGGATLRQVVRGRSAPGSSVPRDTDGIGDGSSADPASPGSGLRSAYLRGVGVNVLNPKVLVFFLAFLPQFAGLDVIDLAAHGGWYAVLTMAYLGVVALSTHRARELLTARPRLVDGLRGLSGVVLLGFGAELLLFGVP
ncbi:LysE family translocator [Halobacteriales archaeon QS_4_70_19]|nr:MAG: LysE family translocator [Halobacteriales archaeon QS_4_70_19]